MDMNLPLFRPEVAQHRRERLLGEVLISRPVSSTVLTTLIAVAVAAAFVFLALNDYTRRETVGGLLVPTLGVVAVYASQPGLLVETYIEDGEQVDQSSKLLKVQVDQKVLAENYLSDEIIQELQAQKARLADSIQLSRDQLTSLLAQQTTSIHKSEQEIDALEGLVQTQTSLLGLEEKSYQRARELAGRGAISKADLEGSERNYLGGLQQLQNLQLTLSNKTFDLQAAVQTKKGYVLSNELEVREIENRLSDISRQIAAARVEQANIIRAPIAGRVTAMLPHLGERVDASRPLLSIVPTDADLEAQLYVPSRAIGFVREGQAVKLRFDAYPYQRFGIYVGTITQVSNAVLTPNELPQLAPKEPVYKVVAALNRQTVSAYGVEVPLRPGILLSADIELDSRSLAEWLLDPLYSLKGRL